MRQPWIVGFDLSLTAPAAVALPRDWRPGDWKRVHAWKLNPKPPKGDDTVGQCRRYRAIADWAEMVIFDLIKWAKPKSTTLFVEAYGFSRNNASASRIQESGGIVKLAVFERHGETMTTVTTSEARKLLVGFHPTRPSYEPKVVVQDALFNIGKAPKTWDDNECDAFAVANFGLAEMGGLAMAIAYPQKAKTKAKKPAAIARKRRRRAGRR
jgi:hypothetical protein